MPYRKRNKGDGDELPSLISRLPPRFRVFLILMLFGAIPCKIGASGGPFFPDKFGASVSDFHQPGAQASSLPGETEKIQKTRKLGDFGNGLHQYYPGSSVHSPYRPCLAGDAENQS